MSTTKAFGILLAIVAIIGVYLAIAGVLGITDYWAGFLFLLQWSMMEGTKRERLPHSAIGAAVGIAIACIPAWFAPAIGVTPALILLTVAALTATFLFIKGWLPVAINAGTMVFLTVATIPHIGRGTTPAAILIGLASGVIYFGGLALIASLIGRLRAGPAVGEPELAA